MIDLKQLDDLAKKLFAILPANLQNIETEIQQKFREILQATFTHMDLVTREEFDVQVRVLARTREKLETLQMQMDNFSRNDNSVISESRETD